MIDIQPVAIVTAASRGMGAACARELSARGYRLALLARAEDVMVLAAELGGLGVIGSVTEEADLRRLVELTLARYGRVDAVVNNTGHPAKGELLGVTDDDWHGGLDLMLLNVVRMARLVTPAMLAQGSGAFANISSYAALRPGLAFPVSATLRAALDNFTALYCQRYAAAGLRMNNVLPGRIDTFPVAEADRQAIPPAVRAPPKRWRRRSRSCCRTTPATSTARACSWMADW